MAVEILTCLVIICTVTTVYGTPINGGDVVNKAKDVPYLAFISVSEGPKCGAAIVHKHIVLTACHCVWGVKEKSILVVTGPSESNKEDEQNLYFAKRYTCHEGYLKEPRTQKNPVDNLNHDLALIRTTREIETGDDVKIYPMAAGIERIEGKKATIAGWGIPKGSSDKDRRLVKVEMTVSDDECDDAQEGEKGLDPNYICTLDREGKKGIDKGDSGGPMVIDNAIAGIVTNAWVEKGVHVGLYARVSWYRQWIDQFIEILMTDGNHPRVVNIRRHIK